MSQRRGDPTAEVLAGPSQAPERDQLRRDPEGLVARFDQHRPRLRRLVEFRLDRRLRARIDASDVLQEVYLDARQRLPHYLKQERGIPFWVWLRQVALQRLVEVHRQHLGAGMRDATREVGQPSPGRSGGDLGTTSLCLVDQLAGSLSTPSQQLIQGERSDRLREALEEMDAIDREVLALRHFEELTNTQVAQLLQLSPTAASNRYVRALKRLRGILSS